MKSGSNAAGPTVAELEDLARRGRAHIIRAIAHAKGGHIGGPLSAMDMLVALYFRIMQIRPEEPSGPTATASSSPRGTAPLPSTPPWRCGATSRSRS